jgi:hypothetical protein
MSTPSVNGYNNSQPVGTDTSAVQFGKAPKKLNIASNDANDPNTKTNGYTPDFYKFPNSIMT